MLQGHGTYSHEASVAHQAHISTKCHLKKVDEQSQTVRFPFAGVDLSVIQTAGETSGDLSTNLQAQTTARS